MTHSFTARAASARHHGGDWCLYEAMVMKCCIATILSNVGNKRSHWGGQDKPMSRFTGYLVGSGRGKFTISLCINWDTTSYQWGTPYCEVKSLSQVILISIALYTVQIVSKPLYIYCKKTKKLHFCSKKFNQFSHFNLHQLSWLKRNTPLLSNRFILQVF